MAKLGHMGTLSQRIPKNIPTALGQLNVSNFLFLGHVGEERKRKKRSNFALIN
jgi:hypothetical protein